MKERASAQMEEAIKTSRHACECGRDNAHTAFVTCGCGRRIPLRFAYRCYYCFEYFCEDCAAIHYGKTREQYRAEKNMAICVDNSNTWRNVLTVGKEYEILRTYDDPYAGYPMVEVLCDDGKIRPYQANRFDKREA
jgi:hypothetical protein